MNWRSLQSAIASCADCVTRWPGEVCRPLSVGEIPTPPGKVEILLVGVAPTPEQGPDHGGHFYSSTADKLRAGVFRLLAGEPFNVPLMGLSLEEGNRRFFEAGYFFVHAAKVRPVVRLAPPRDCMRHCASRHLREEIALLEPTAICFMGKGNAGPAAATLFGDAGSEPREATVGNWRGLVAVAPQPVRGHERTTREVLVRLGGGPRP